MSICPPPGKISAECLCSSLMHKTTRLFQALFPQKELGRVLAICLQILFNDWCQRHQNNLAICIFMAL